MEPRILSLFTGYGGLDMAIETVTGGHVIAVSDIDPGPCKLLAARRPECPNLGDIKAVEWEDVDSFDVLVGGYPCQPFSMAGRRAGKDDPRHLWPDVLKAIETHQPNQVFLENVRGHLSLGFDTVLTDLANAGYSVTWTILAASSVGTAHRRERLYIYATPGHAANMSEVSLPAKLPTAGVLDTDGLTVLDRVDESVRRSSTVMPLFPTPKAGDGIMGRPRTSGRPIEKSTHLGTIATLLPAAMPLFPTPDTNSGGGGPLTSAQRRAQGRTVSVFNAVMDILPTPTARDHKGGSAPKRRGGKSLGDLPTLLPTPNTMDNMYTRNGEAMERQLRRGEGPDASRRTSMGNLREDIMVTLDPTRFATDDPDERDKALMDAGLTRSWSPFNNAEWGKYAHAVARWSMLFGALPPAPVEPNTKGNPRLTAEFCEWLMGVPAGHITGEDINLTRTEAIKLAGNGVVPHAAVAAFTRLIERMD